MSQPSFDIPIRPAANGGGGTQPVPEGTTSGLGLVAPRFFPGQALDAQDLNAILRYTRERLALERFRGGWGVVCGLGVGGGPDENGAGASRVWIGAGYAVGPDGWDIVVPRPVPFDVEDVCRAARPESGSGGPCPELLTADLYVRHAEKAIDPRPALTGTGGADCNGCGGRRPCEPSRTVDGFAFEARVVPPDSDPMRPAIESFEKAWYATTDVVRCYLEQFGYGCHWSVKAWFENWVRVHPLYQLLWIRQAIDDLPPDPDTAAVVEILFWLVQDARLRMVAETRGCAAGGDPAGVLLARLWISLAEPGRCQVQQINTFPPYRRPFGLDTWPAPLGDVNLIETIWMRWAEARGLLTGAGVVLAQPQRLTPPQTFEQLGAALASELFARPGPGAPTYRTRIIETSPSTNAVIGFLVEGSAAASPNGPAPPPPPPPPPVNPVPWGRAS